MYKNGLEFTKQSVLRAVSDTPTAIEYADWLCEPPDTNEVLCDVLTKGPYHANKE